MRHNDRGYAVIVTCLLLPVVLLSLGMITFSLLKTRHSHQVKAACQQNYFTYFSALRTEISIVETLNPWSVTLYHMQMSLIPMIWLPPALKAYRLILKLRQTLQKLQNFVISSFNMLNIALSIKTFAGIQRALHGENRKVTTTLPHQSLAVYSANPKLQIRKRMNILFPPYDPHPQILKRQQFSVSIRSVIKPKTWMSAFVIPRLNETYMCTASLKPDSNNALTISYQL